MPTSAVSAYQNASTWKDWKYVKNIGSSVGAVISATIGDLNYLLDSNDKTALVMPQSTSLSGAITIPSSVSYSGYTYRVTGLAAKAFRGCSSITSVTIPSTITSLSNECFYNCSRLSSVTIPTSVTSFGDYCFYYCSALTSVTIPSSVKSLGAYCFAGSGLQSITIPSNVTSIGEWCFYYCRSLANVFVSAQTQSLPNYCFYDCSNLQNISISNSVKTIGGDCFYNCTSLSSIAFPSALQLIYSRSFNGCSKLNNVIIPSSVTSLGAECFHNCASLSKLTCNATTPPSVGSSAFSGTLYQYGNLLVPTTAVSAYENAGTWKDWKYIQSIGNSTTYIVGNGTVKSTIPYGTDYKYSTTQMVYTPSEVTSGKGTISKIAFNVANTGSNTPYELKIYMAHRTGRIADAASAIPSEDLTLVYSGTPTLASSTGWETINLTNPFEYDGKSYLAIVVCRKSSSTSGNSYYSTKQSSGWTLTRESDDDYNYGVVTGTAEFDATRNRPNVQFTKVVIEPTSISFANASETVFLGKTKTLTATINPENAHNKTITWSSSNVSVATVSSKGVVTAKSLGTATITAKTFNGKTATCTVYVKEPVTAITLSDLTATLWVGATKTITATATPSTASSTAVTWSSSNTSVATVSSYGVITARAAGTCTITCKAADGSGISKSCAVTVKQPVTSIALSVNDATIWVGKTKTIKATVNPTNASKTTVKWSSSDPLVATVSSKGVIKAVGKGTCIITCTAADGYGTTSTCEVTVKQQITSIDFGYETLSVTCGTTKTLAPKIYPSDASIQTLTWKSKNTGVAKVSSDGVLTAVAPGTAKIICTATDGFKKADTITVEVVPLKITDSKPAIAKGTYGAGGISYTRTITAGKYVAFCLPYAVDLSNYTDEFSKVYVPMGVALHKSNGTVMISLKKVSLTETISAGQPFVALVAKSGSVAVVNDVKVTVTSLAEPKGNKLEVYDLGTNFITYNPDIEVKITGNYAKITGLDNTSNFTFSTSGSMSKATTVSPYRLYVTKNDERSNAKISDIQFSFEEDETVTGIEDLKIANDESLVDDSPIYNLKGQRVNRANAQQKGVYIINGKKHIK